MPTLTILETGQAPEKIRSDWPDYPAMFETLLSPYLKSWSYRAIAVSRGEVLPEPGGLDAVLITGSPAGVYDTHLGWVSPLMAFIQTVAKRKIPQIGICFGHQAIAYALGAKVEKSDKGWGIGRHIYEIKAPQLWMGQTPPRQFALGVSHQDQVLTRPPGAICVAGSDFCPFAALAYPKANAISFQGHPEFSAAFSCALYGIRKGTALSVEAVTDAEQSLKTPPQNALIGEWIARFLTQSVPAQTSS